MRTSPSRPGSLAVVILLTALASAAFAVITFRVVSAAQNEADAVRAALVQSVAAFERGDMAALNALWANDESVTVFEQGHANYGWTDYRDNHLVPEMKEMKNTKYALSDIRIKTSGAAAWATFKFTISADVDGRHVDGAGLGTAVLEQRQDRWQIVHWHTSAPRRAPVAQPSPAQKH